MSAQRPSKRQRIANKSYHVVLFYNYRPLSTNGNATQMDLPKFCSTHKTFCLDLQLTGRVLVANEGINGTVASSDLNKLNQYTEMLKNHPLYTLKESDFKRSTAQEEPFPDLFIKPVKEIINSGGAIPVPGKGQGGIHLSPEDFHLKLTAAQNNKNNKTDNTKEQTTKETVILDIRNHTEYMVGHFQGAIDPNLRTFAEFPKYLQSKAEEFKNKTVLMYCTGGIRCEKASFHLKKLGVEDVYQLEGGVHKYLEAYPEGGEWNGKNFVFDKRVFQPTPNILPEKRVIGTCYNCNTKFDELDGEAVCTVCRDMVLVCHTCRPVLKYQYHCNRHLHLSTCYYTDLNGFNATELLEQQNQLQEILTEMEKVIKKDLKKTKNQRRTIRKQIEKLNVELTQRKSGGGGAINSNSSSSSSSSSNSDTTTESKCRTCGKTTCAGKCWGIWKQTDQSSTTSGE